MENTIIETFTDHYHPNKAVKTVLVNGFNGTNHVAL